MDEDTDHMHERYAKVALLMFYPHRKLNNLEKRGSYWELFHYNLNLYIRNKKNTRKRDSKYYKTFRIK